MVLEVGDTRDGGGQEVRFGVKAGFVTRRVTRETQNLRNLARPRGVEPLTPRSVVWIFVVPRRAIRFHKGPLIKML